MLLLQQLACLDKTRGVVLKVQLTPANANAAALSGVTQVYAPAAANGYTWTLVSGSTALTAARRMRGTTASLG